MKMCKADPQQNARDKAEMRVASAQAHVAETRRAFNEAQHALHEAENDLALIAYLFPRGVRVLHPEHGQGVILSVSDWAYEVAFDYWAEPRIITVSGRDRSRLSRTVK